MAHGLLLFPLTCIRRSLRWALIRAMTSSASSLGEISHSFTASSSYPSASLQFPTTDNYFSIDDILASQQRVPVQFELPVYRLGFLNPSSTNEHLEAGLKMELPFWLAKVLGSKKRQIVNVELPRSYKENQRDILSADAKVVDLYKLGPYYYTLGMKILCFEHLERRDLSKSLLETFLNRFRSIMDNSQNAFQTDTYLLTSKLDETERTLFYSGQKATERFEDWEKGVSHRITSSLILQTNRNRKRKRVQ